jgi:hypothetical protein
MRRIEFTIQTQNHGIGKIRWSANGLFRAFSIFCLLLTTLWSPTLHAQCALVCNDDENISMPGTDVDCTVEITIDMVLEDPGSCPNGILSVELSNIQGQPLPTSPFINESHIGTTVIYSVIDADHRAGVVE